MTEAPNPYAPPRAEVAPAAEPGPEERVPATRRARLAAAFLDGLISALPASLVAVALGGWLFGTGPLHAAEPLLKSGWPELDAATEAVLDFLVIQAIYWAFNGIGLLERGQSLGKRICGIRIVRSDGSRADFRHVFLVRHLAFAVLGVVPYLRILALVDLAGIFRSSRRCLHDDLADTRVVKVRG